MCYTTKLAFAVGFNSQQNILASMAGSRRMFLRFSYLFLVIVLASQSVNSAQAVVIGVTNIANGKSIIGGTNNLEAGAYNSTTSNFSVDNVTDGQNASPNNNTGTITEAFADDSYWGGPSSAMTNSASGRPVPLTYFVIDLGASYILTKFDLFNTSNGHALDRGTAQFTITASNSITAPGALGSDLSGTPVTLVSSTLAVGNHTATPGQQAIVNQSFLSGDTGDSYRYIRFDALTSISPNGANNGAGLAEIRVFTTPEPGSATLLLLGCCGAIAVKRARNKRSR